MTVRNQTPVTSNQKWEKKEEIVFDFENLLVYQKALDFIDNVFDVVRMLRAEFRYPIADNLIRAAVSIANNLAEGNDKYSVKERRRYFGISSDSARECVSVLIILRRQSLLTRGLYVKLKKDAREITNMIRGLIR